jgi:hypothetical protein
MRTLCLILLSLATGYAQVDVLTQHNDNQRSGLNTRETVLTQQSVRAKFGKLWMLYSDAKIMAQPLYVSNLVVPADKAFGAVAKSKCPAGCNAIIFASMKGTVYAYLADVKPQTINDTLIWAKYLGDPRIGNGDIDMWAVDDPWWGILGTPVIDRTKNLIYAVVWNSDTQYRLYSLDLISGNVSKGPIVINGSVAGLPFVETTQGWIQRRKQRAGLLLSNGSLFVAFGGDNDLALAGWLFVYDAANLSLKAVWSPTPGGRSGGIWQSGQGLAADSTGNIFLQTGNGDFDPTHQLFGDSLLRLSLDNGAVKVADYFAPCNQKILNSCDLDQGSSGPLLFDGFVIGGGKNGELYFMRADKLGQYTPGPWPEPALNCNAVPQCQDGPLVLQKWQAAMGHIHGSPVFWNGPAASWLYVMGEGDHLNAFQFANGKFDVNAAKQSKWMPKNPGSQPCGQAVRHWMPGGIISVSSDGNKAGTGIVWAIVPANGDANSFRGVKGMLLALNAEDVSKELWRSQGTDPAVSDTPNSLGLLARFVPPTIANGKVFIATAGDKEPLQAWCGARPQQFPQNYGLVVYGLTR